jgi:citrate lyase alpha subunit
VGLWKHIKKGREILSSFTRIEVGNGIRISFWHDMWYGDMVLKVVFQLYLVWLM